MFVGEFPTMDEPEGAGEDGLGLDYSLQKMNLSSRDATQVSFRF